MPGVGLAGEEEEQGRGDTGGVSSSCWRCLCFQGGHTGSPRTEPKPRPNMVGWGLHDLARGR